jgi:hypothetical protein
VALFDARTTFVVLLAWGGFAATYTIAGRILRSLGRRGPIALSSGAAAAVGTLEAYRDDGPLARALGRIPLPPLPAIAYVLGGLLPLLAVAALAGGDVAWWVAGALVAWLVLAAGASSGRPLRDRLRWMVPPALRVAEYAGLLWVASVAGGSAVPAAFALLCAITYRHYDTVYRLRQRGETTPRWLDLAAGGWDGRLLIGCVLAAAGAVPAGFYAAAALLAIVLLGETLASWLSYERTSQPESYDDDEEDAG